MCLSSSLAWSAHAKRRIVRILALGAAPIAYLSTYLSYSRAGIIGTSVAVLAVLLLSRNRITAALNTAAAAAGAAIAVIAVRGAPEIARATGTRGLGGALLGIAAAVRLCAAAAFATSALRTDRAAVPRSVSRPLLAVGLTALVMAGAVLWAAPRLTGVAFVHAPDGHHPDVRSNATTRQSQRQPLLRVEGGAEGVPDASPRRHRRGHV